MEYTYFFDWKTFDQSTNMSNNITLDRKNNALVYFEGNIIFNDNHVAILKFNKKCGWITIDDALFEKGQYRARSQYGINDFEYFDRSTIYR